MLLAISILVATAVAIELAVVVWGWTNDTLHESPQERVNLQFDAIVRHFQADAGA